MFQIQRKHLYKTHVNRYVMKDNPCFKCNESNKAYIITKTYFFIPNIATTLVVYCMYLPPWFGVK